MARDYFINGETLVTVDGTELGVCSDPIVVSVVNNHLDINVDAFGRGVPMQQYLIGEASIGMSLVHFDRGVLDTALRKSHAGATVGVMPRAGTLMSGFYMALRMSSPQASKPWRFPTAYITNENQYPLGTERSLAVLTWRALPIVADPQTALGAILWDYT